MSKATVSSWTVACQNPARWQTRAPPCRHPPLVLLSVLLGGTHLGKLCPPGTDLPVQVPTFWTAVCETVGMSSWAAGGLCCEVGAVPQASAAEWGPAAAAGPREAFGARVLCDHPALVAPGWAQRVRSQLGKPPLKLRGSVRFCAGLLR